MMHKKLYCIIATALLLLSEVSASAQFFRKLDEWFRKKQARQVYDTTYIYRPQERWLVRTQSFFSGESSDLHAARAGSDINLTAGSGLMFKQTIGGGYRGLVIDAGFAPGKKDKNADLEIKIYGNKLGVRLGGAFAYGYRGRTSVNGTEFELQPGDVIGANAYLNAYFAFNGKRFSMPAATNQNYRQIRSAGSPLLTFKTQLYGMFTNPLTYPDAEITGAATAYIGLGGGYGFNWVPGENWLVHFSLTETIGFLNESSLLLKDDRDNYSWESPIFVTSGDLAVLYYYKKWYFGVHANAEDLLFWNNRDMDFQFNKFATKANVTAGVRF